MLVKLRTYCRLGLANLFRVAVYQLMLKTGYLRRRLPIGQPITGKCFSAPVDAEVFNRFQSLKLTPDQLASCTLFGWYQVSSEHTPQWHRSVLSGKHFQGAEQHWTNISDFTSGVGDIKGVWELSRFSWAPWLVNHYLASGDSTWLQKLNNWLLDWSQTNPANQGPNWKCAQETSFRILHLATCARLLEQKRPSPTLCLWLTEHLNRILPTLGYARAQDNNHGTSEAAAMFVASTWMLQNDPQDTPNKHLYNASVKYLCERLDRLILKDGTFSQYSLTYHRLMLDSTVFVELWRRFLELPPLPDSFYRQLKKATHWFVTMLESTSGDGPNLGANDGAHILQYLPGDYRDMRVTAELSASLFLGISPFRDKDALCQQVATLLSVAKCKANSPQQAVKFAEGGYGVLSNEQARCVFNVPRFRFRPSQADGMHLDLWVNGVNLLRDAGSYSYNTEQKWLDYFSGVQAHNSVQFDNRVQMPKLSRFLYAHWLQAHEFAVSSEQMMATASCKDWRGAVHRRTAQLKVNSLTITDEVSGFRQNACIRWRLPQRDWWLEQDKLSDGRFCIQVASTKSIRRLALVEGHESRYYGQKNSIPVLEIDVSENAEITTTITW